MNSKGLLALTLLLIIPALSQAEIYRWVDDQGNVIFGDNPPDSRQAQTIEKKQLQETGGRLATDDQVNSLRQGITHSSQNTQGNDPKDSHCRGYVKELNQVESFLKHTYTKHDERKAADLKKLISKECGSNYRERKFDDYYCEDYRQKLSKLEIFMKHSPNDLDRQKANDLREQIRRECR